MRPTLHQPSRDSSIRGERARGARERLAFSFVEATVPGRASIDAARAREAGPTFATAAYAEPRDWGYLGLNAFTAVLLLRPQDSFPALAPLHLAEICALIGILPMLLHRFAFRRPVFRMNVETNAVVGLGLVILLTIPFSIWPGGALQEFTDSYVKVVIVFVLMMNTLTTPQRLQRLMWLILVCTGFIAARGVFDYARGVNLLEGGRLTGAVNGLFGNPNDLALNMVTFMPAAAIIAISRRHAFWKRGIAALIVALMMATVVFTKSRGGVVGLVAMLVALTILGRQVRRGFGTIVVATILLSAPLMPASFWARMTSIVDSEQDQKEFTGSRESRRIVMQEGIATFLERPLTGVGIGQFRNYNPTGRREKWLETHNALIQVAADTGVMGLLVFTFLIVRAGKAAVITRRWLRRPRRRDAGDPLTAVLSADDRETLYAHTVAMTAGLVGWFTCAMFASVAYSWTFYYLLALTVAAHAMVQDRLTAGQRLDMRKTISVPRASFHPRMAPGVT